MAKTVFVNVKCPICGASLMDHEQKMHEKPSIKLSIQSGSNSGHIHLCSIYGCYDHTSDIKFSEGDIARFMCPTCNKELKGAELCDKCNAPMVPLILEGGGKVSFCSRKGCTKHQIVFEDVNNALQLFYDEFES